MPGRFRLSRYSLIDSAPMPISRLATSASARVSSNVGSSYDKKYRPGSSPIIGSRFSVRWSARRFSSGRPQRFQNWSIASVADARFAELSSSNASGTLNACRIVALCVANFSSDCRSFAVGIPVEMPSPTPTIARALPLAPRVTLSMYFLKSLTASGVL